MEDKPSTQIPPPAYQPNGKSIDPAIDIPLFAPPEYAPESSLQRTNTGQNNRQFYDPSQNRILGSRRKFYSFAFCSILICIAVCLAIGIAYNGGSDDECYCQTNSDCHYKFGAGTYCDSGCQCLRY